MKRSVCFGWALLLTIPVALSAQTVSSYTIAPTDRLIHAKTPMAPPPVNTVFEDPDFHSRIVRVTDEQMGTAGGFFRNPASGEKNAWSQDTRKFYVVREDGAAVAFGFDGLRMKVEALAGAAPGQGLELPLVGEPSCSFVDPDLIYGTLADSPFILSSYRFSTGVVATVADLTACGVQPPFSPGAVSGYDLMQSATDRRFSIAGDDMFVIVYDRNLGCRWYNTQTGQIGGRWGPSGTATKLERDLIDQAHISKSGEYVRIEVLSDTTRFYVWQVDTLNVTPCSGIDWPYCGGYGAGGFSHIVNTPGVDDAMNVWIRPFGNLSGPVALIAPLPTPPHWDLTQRWSWVNANSDDSVPLCGTTYYYTHEQIDQVWDREIICIETDGAASTVWRFAHHRASANDAYFSTMPLGNVSQDGRFFLFSSDWENQLGTSADGTPRSDVWIVELR